MHFDFTPALPPHRSPTCSTRSATPPTTPRFAGAAEAGRPRGAEPQRSTGDRVALRVRYRFTGDLAPAARAVLDPDKLTWVEESSHDLAARKVTFVLEPDHYADRFQAHGSYRFEVDPADTQHTLRLAQGDVKVRALLVAASVERAIISGLKEHLDDEVALLEHFLAR